MDIAGLTADRTNTYNVWTTQTELWKKSLESAEMGEDTQKQLKAFQEGESTENAGYTNNTNTPIVLEQVRWELPNMKEPFMAVNITVYR